MSAVDILQGQAVPLALQLEDGDTGKFPQAVVRNPAGGAVVGSPFDLAHRGEGGYTNTALTMPTETFLHVTYITYNEVGHTTESAVHLRAQDVFKRVDILSDDTPFGGADVAAILADTNSLDATKITTARANNLDEITAARLAELDPANIPTDLSNIEADTQNIQTRLPAALVVGRMDSDVAVIQAGAVNAAAVATDAIDADALAADAAIEIGVATDVVLTATHGAGSWVGTSAQDWNSAEREQIRFRLAMDGVQTDPTTGVGTVEDILSETERLRYNNGRHVAIHFDSAASNTGTVVGVDGTYDNPVSTEGAMLALSTATGIDTLEIAGFLAMGAVSYAGKNVGGRPGDAPFVDVTAATSLFTAQFENTFLAGPVPGSAFIKTRGCQTFGLTNYGGEMIACHLTGVIGIAGAGALFLGCQTTGVGAGTTIDMSGAGAGGGAIFGSLAGDVTVTGMTAPGRLVELDMIGAVTVDATCALGTVRIAGPVSVTDNSGPGCTVDVSAVVPVAGGSADLMSLYEGVIWIDPISGSPGAVLGVNGTQKNPVLDDSDAATLAAALGTREYRLVSDTTLTLPLTNWTVVAREDAVTVDLNAQTLSSVRFDWCNVTGSYTGTIEIVDGTATTMTHDRTDARRTAFVGTHLITVSGRLRLYDCFFSAAGPVCVLDLGVGANVTEVRAFGCSGIVEVDNFDFVGSSCDINGGALDVTYRASCTDGTARLTGSGRRTNLGSGSFVLLDDGFIPGDEVQETLDWNKNRRRVDFLIGPPRQLVLYERDGVTEKFRMNLTTTNGTEVLAFFGVQHERGVPT